MRLTVLGASPAFPNCGGACSGYLVEYSRTRILLDCGSGVAGNLRRYAGYRYLDAIVISHMHADHFLDLIPLRYGLKYGPGAGGRERMKLYLPAQGRSILSQVVAPLDPAPDFFSEFFEIIECEPSCSVRIGELEVTLAPVCHFIPSHGIVMTGDSKLGYSADTGPCDDLKLVAQDAGLFLCESALPEGYEGADAWGHLRASDAGRIAAEAGAKRLLLTHMWDEYNPGESIAAASRAFPGPVERAKEGMIVEF